LHYTLKILDSYTTLLKYQIIKTEI
jgi:hypothetical protein